MPLILPKNQIKLQHLKKIFVDRKIILQKIDDRLCDKSLSLITNIYGIGGMGKTRLMKKIEFEIDNNYKSCGVVVLDLEFTNTDPIPNYEIITQKLTKYGFNFPCYYNAIIKYMKEMGYNDRIPVFDRRLSEYPEVPEFAIGISNIFLNKLYDNFPAKILLSVSSSIDNKCKRQTSYIKNFLNYFDPLAKEEKLKFLGTALYLDIINSPLHEKWKIVFIIDTYEKFYEQKYPLSSTSDFWLLEFVENFFPIENQKTRLDPIFIISGRDPIHWESYRDIPKSLIDKYPAIEKLEKEDCEEYLIESKIPRSLHDTIYRKSDGYPFPLQMLAFLYFQLEEKGEVLPSQIELSAGDHYKLYETVIRHLPNDIVRLLESLAFCSWFDRKILHKIAVNLHHFSWGEQSFEDVTGYAFCKNIDEEKYCLQKTFKEILIKNYTLRFPSDFIKRKHATLFNYYSNYYEKEKHLLNDYTKILLIREMCIHGIYTPKKQKVTIENLNILCSNYQDYSFVSNFTLDLLDSEPKRFTSFNEVIKTYIQHFPLSTFDKFMQVLSSEKEIRLIELEDLKKHYFLNNYLILKNLKSKSTRPFIQDLHIIKKYVDLNKFFLNFSDEDILQIISRSSLAKNLDFLKKLRRIIGRDNYPITKIEKKIINVFLEKDIHSYKDEYQEHFFKTLILIYSYLQTFDKTAAERLHEKLKKELSNSEKEQLLRLGFPL